ncbi:MAG: manganese efflux pump [Clostridia bacterium]|nr:manganese efflux pump [Clostridia bacterium]
MNIPELFLLAVGLAMDAFAVSVCKGLASPRVGIKQAALCGVWFGGFQALMPFIGYLLGRAFAVYIESFDHWVAFVLLGVIGISMIREAFDKDEGETNASFAPRVMLVMAIATSIDALAAGITLAMPGVNIVLALALIGGITFALSAVGVKIGNVFGARYRFAAELCGGIILILLGAKILLEHLGILAL